MAKVTKKTQAKISADIRKEVKKGTKQEKAIAIALSKARARGAKVPPKPKKKKKK